MKIAVVTAARSEYGLLRYLLEEIESRPALELQLVVTGAHLANTFGSTVQEIEKDGFRIDARVEMLLDSSSSTAISKSMALAAMGISDVFQRLAPDLVLVLGDRYELLPICSTAVVMRIPIAHVSGGDLTEGAIDDQIRHAVTKLAALHFPGTEESARRIIQMGEEPWRVHAVGEPGLDGFLRCPATDRETLAKNLGLDPKRDWALLTYHPETHGHIVQDIKRLDALLKEFLKRPELQVLATYPNADAGSGEIIALLQGFVDQNGDRARLVKSAGHSTFVNLLRQSRCIVGNSSCLIVESPTARIPALNVGARQKGRLLAENIINWSGEDEGELERSIERLLSAEFHRKCDMVTNPYGDGATSFRIAKVLEATRIESLLPKRFYGG